MQSREITAHLEKVPGVWEKVSRDGVRLDRHQHQRGCAMRLDISVPLWRTTLKSQGSIEFSV